MKKIIILLVISYLVTITPLWGQQAFEYPMIASALGEHGGFYMANYMKSYISFYIMGKDLKEAQTNDRIVLMKGEQRLDIIFVNPKHIVADPAKVSVDNLLKTHSKWECDYIIKSTPGMKVLKAQALKFAKYNCYLSYLEYPKSNTHHIIVSVLANKAIVVFNLPIFPKKNKQFSVTNYDEAVAFLEEIFKTFHIHQEPISFLTLSKMIADEAEMF